MTVPSESTVDGASPWWRQWWVWLLVAGVVAAAVVATIWISQRGDEEAVTVATTSSTTSTVTSSSTSTSTSSPTTVVPKTIEQVTAELQAAAAAQVEPGGTRVSDVTCDVGDMPATAQTQGSGPVHLGDVLACRGEWTMPDGTPIEGAFWTVAIVSEDGRWAADSGIDGIWDAPAGLNCNQLFEQHLVRQPRPPYNQIPGGEYASENYTLTLAYFFLHDQPSNMDIDGNGVPCETVYPSDVVEQVWAGGIISANLPSNG